MFKSQTEVTPFTNLKNKQTNKNNKKANTSKTHSTQALQVGGTYSIHLQHPFLQSNICQFCTTEVGYEEKACMEIKIWVQNLIQHFLLDLEGGHYPTTMLQHSSSFYLLTLRCTKQTSRASSLKRLPVVIRVTQCAVKETINFHWEPDDRLQITLLS